MIGGLVGALEWLKDAKRCWLNENNGVEYIKEAELHMKEINLAVDGYRGYRAIKEKEQEIRIKAISEFVEQLSVACSKNTFCTTINGMKNVEIMTLDSVTRTVYEEADGILEAKARMIPQKPIRIDECTCPKCGTYNEMVKKRRNTVAFDTVYCWHCGQAMEVRRELHSGNYYENGKSHSAGGSGGYL